MRFTPQIVTRDLCYVRLPLKAFHNATLPSGLLFSKGACDSCKKNHEVSPRRQDVSHLASVREVINLSYCTVVQDCSTFSHDSYGHQSFIQH